MYFFNFEKENEWRFSLKDYLSVLEIPGTLMNLVLSPHAAEKKCVKGETPSVSEETSPTELYGPGLTQLYWILQLVQEYAKLLVHLKKLSLTKPG